MWIVQQGATDALWNAADLHLEDGSVVDRRARAASRPAARLPPARARATGGRARGSWSRRPARTRSGSAMWGWAVQLYAARSRASWGIGDLDDLARLATLVVDAGRARCSCSTRCTRSPPCTRSSRAPTTPRVGMWRNPLALHDRVDARSGRISATSSTGSRTRRARSTNAGSSTATRCSASSERRSIALFAWWTAHADQRQRDAFAAFCARARRRPSSVRHLLRARRAPRRRLAGVATELSLPDVRARRALRP